MRSKLIVGNWKMNLTKNEIKKFFKNFIESDNYKANVAVCVPFVYVEEAIKCAKNTKFKIGVQNVSTDSSGAFTGEVSAEQLADFDIEYIIIGHSERRQYFMETDIEVNKKIKQALKNGFNPILCVGELLEEKEAGHTMDIIETQISLGLNDIESQEDLGKIVIAYEPVWAIGTGVSATVEIAEEVCGNIRKLIEKVYGEEIANNMVIQYGGSVTSDTIDELLAQENIDGALVGGASIDPEHFSKIIN